MNDITPTNEQAGAIKAVQAWYKDKSAPKEFYLAGFAGVGKSTLVNLALRDLKLKQVRTAAFTGKAASVLRKKGIDDAQTIHSLIYRAKVDKQTGKVTFKIAYDSPAADADLIVLDECSMVNDSMANDLRSFGKKILVMGDPGQLPPISGAGAFTNRAPDVFLQEIHRQSAESPIIELATLARQGKPLPIGFDSKGVKVMTLTKETQEQVYDKNSQPICGLNRVRWAYTQRIRKRLGFEYPNPQKGEKLICCKNNVMGGFFNGSIAELNTFKRQSAVGDMPETYTFDVKFDDLDAHSPSLLVDPWLFNQHFTNGAAKKIEWVKGNPRYEEFDWGYVLTCHKAQGSSWENVTVIDDSEAFRENKEKWLYTALTRAEEGLTVLVRQ